MLVPDFYTDEQELLYPPRRDAKGFQRDFIPDVSPVDVSCVDLAAEESARVEAEDKLDGFDELPEPFLAERVDGRKRQKGNA